MILETLAAVALAGAPQDAGAPPAPTPVSPVVVPAPPKASTEPPAATVNVPTDDTAAGGVWASVWPQSAYRARISGHVVLRCDIDRHGLAEWCKVGSETPAKQGFGAAAMQLRPTFKLKPATGPDGPVDAVMNIAVEFKAPDPRLDFGGARGGGEPGETSNVTMFGDPLLRRSVSMLNNPVWVRTVGYDDVVNAYPAKAGGAEGYVVAHCQVGSKGALSGCQVIREVPEKHGFGKAALGLASKFQVAPEWAVAPGHAELWVDIPIRFPAPGAAESRTMTSPYWVSGFDPDQALRMFPPEAAAKGVTSGHGVAKCVVAQDGSLTDCAPQEADPDGLGFSEAAAKLASTMKMNPWTVDGEPVDGAVVRVGVRLDLKSQQ